MKELLYLNNFKREIDLKSFALLGVPVRVWPRALLKK